MRLYGKQLLPRPRPQARRGDPGHRRQALAVVLILSGAGDGGGGPTPFPGPDPARSPAPTPRRAPRPPAAAPTRGAAATNTMRPAGLLLLPSLLALLAHGKGPRRPAAERGARAGSRRWEGRIVPGHGSVNLAAQLRHRVPPAALPPRRPSRAGRGLRGREAAAAPAIRAWPRPRL